MLKRLPLNVLKPLISLELVEIVWGERGGVYTIFLTAEPYQLALRGDVEEVITWCCEEPLIYENVGTTNEREINRIFLEISTSSGTRALNKYSGEELSNLKKDICAEVFKRVKEELISKRVKQPAASTVR